MCVSAHSTAREQDAIDFIAEVNRLQRGCCRGRVWCVASRARRGDVLGPATASILLGSAAMLSMSGLLDMARRALSRSRCDDADVIDDADTAQARELLQSLHAHVDEISKKVESAESRRDVFRVTPL
jgi:hypothetical protein